MATSVRALSCFPTTTHSLALLRRSVPASQIPLHRSFHSSMPFLGKTSPILPNRVSSEISRPKEVLHRVLARSPLGSPVRSFLSQCRSPEAWNQVFQLANQHYELTSRRVTVNLAEKDRVSEIVARSGYNLLEIQNPDGSKKLIDVFRLTPNVGKDVQKLVGKVLQHLRFMETPGCLISPFGRKIDVRKLPPEYRLEMGENGQIILNGLQVETGFLSCSVNPKDLTPFSSTTIVRVLQLRQKIFFFDDDSIQKTDSAIPIIPLEKHPFKITLNWPNAEIRNGLGKALKLFNP